MISLKALAVGCSLAGALYAQHVGVLNPQQPSALAAPNAFPYGNILFPGGVPSSHANNLGATINGRLPAPAPLGPGMGQGRGGGYGRGRTVVVPYGVPVYYGGATMATDITISSPPPT
jgi:hypothetical protein